MATMRNFAVRLDDAQVARLERLAEAIAEHTPGMDVTRSDAIRATIERGLDALEAEHQVPSAARPSKKRAAR